MCGHRAKYLRLTGNQGPFSIPKRSEGSPERGAASGPRGSPGRAGRHGERRFSERRGDVPGPTDGEREKADTPADTKSQRAADELLSARGGGAVPELCSINEARSGGRSAPVLKRVPPWNFAQNMRSTENEPQLFHC